jgi:hypothetical protein
VELVLVLLSPGFSPVSRNLLNRFITWRCFLFGLNCVESSRIVYCGQQVRAISGLFGQLSSSCVALMYTVALGYGLKGNESLKCETNLYT